MDTSTDDIWRTRSLERLGDELAALEQALPRPSRPRRRRTRAALPAVALASALVATLLALLGGPAGATSIINRAPAAAIRSNTVRFDCTIQITRGGRLVRRFAQAGEADFATHRYQATLTAGAASEGLQWRTVGGVLYAAHTRIAHRTAGTRTWVAIRLAPAQQAALASAPEADAVTDPLAVLRIMRGIQTPVARVGRAVIDGVATTAYRTTTNLASLLQASTGSPHASRAYSDVAAALTAWLDPQGRPRRVEEVLRSRSSREQVEMRAVLRLSGYGQRVTVLAPIEANTSRTLRSGPPRPLADGPTHVFEHLLR